MLCVPYDHARVLLPTETDNYINAAHLKVLLFVFVFILMQRRLFGCEKSLETYFFGFFFFRLHNQSSLNREMSIRRFKCSIQMNNFVVVYFNAYRLPTV